MRGRNGGLDREEDEVFVVVGVERREYGVVVVVGREAK